MGEAVESAVGEDGVIEERDPLVHGAVTRDHSRGAAVALDEDIVEVTGLLGRELPQAEIIELCGAPHNSTYGEHSVMWSAAAPRQELSSFSRT
jgi:hypothetical protein